jgi:hypothetical protein
VYGVLLKDFLSFNKAQRNANERYHAGVVNGSKSIGFAQ